jgi:RNA polymerase primary sigma factor
MRKNAKSREAKSREAYEKMTRRVEAELAKADLTGKIPGKKGARLTRQEETELAKKIEAGRDAQSKLDQGISNDVAMDERLAEEGREAKCFFIESFVGLVHFVAGKYYSHARASQNLARAGLIRTGPTVTYDDLVQEGTLGVMSALEKFDWRMGNRFSTLAWWYIRDKMARANRTMSRTIRLPENMHTRIRKIKSAKEALSQHFQREPTLDELAEGAGFTLDQVVDALEKDRLRPVDLQPWTELNEGKQESSQQKLMRDMDMDSVRSEIDDLLKEVTPLQRQVLIQRFGLHTGEPRTLEAVAESLGITAQSVMRLQQNAMNKMRSPMKLWRVKKLTSQFDSVHADDAYA